LGGELEGGGLIDVFAMLRFFADELEALHGAGRDLDLIGKAALASGRALGRARGKGSGSGLGAAGKGLVCGAELGDGVVHRASVFELEFDGLIGQASEGGLDGAAGGIGPSAEGGGVLPEGEAAEGERERKTPSEEGMSFEKKHGGD
jgi:hypothetical protein